MAQFTPQQIEQFLQEFFDVVGTRQYVGARYVPVFGHGGNTPIEWDNSDAYEPLSIVYHVGTTYTSRQYVPVGVDIHDTNYWVITANYNAQVEQYRQEVLSFQGQIDTLRDDLESDYVPFPDSNHYAKYGTLGQVLTTLADGETKWEDPVTVDAAIAEPLIESWLDDHPEATTTVQDGSLTWAKFASSLMTKVVKGMGNILSPGTITDANTVVRNSVYVISSTARPVSNLPTTENVMLVTFGNGDSDDSIAPAAQLCFLMDTSEIYSRQRYGSGGSQWTNWVRVDNSSIEYAMLGSTLQTKLMKGMGNVLASGTISDLNTVVRNSIYVIGSTALPVANMPFADNAMVVTFGSGESDAAVAPAAQLCFNLTNSAIYSRQRYGSGGSLWSDWVRIDNVPVTYSALDSALQKKLMKGMGDVLSPDIITDADGVSRNTIYAIGETARPISNLPTDDNVILVSFGDGEHDESTAINAQLCFDTTDGSLYSRQRWGSGGSPWTTWNHLQEQVIQTGDLAMFSSIGGIGDSWSAGVIYDTSNNVILDNQDYGIFGNLGRQINATVRHYSHGGWGAYDYVHDNTSNSMTQTLTDIANDNACDCYMIAFGLNDASSSKTFGGVSGGMSYIGSVSDVNHVDPTQNANTYWGNMCRIIDTLKSASSGSKIIVIPIWLNDNSTQKAFYTAAQNIAQECMVMFFDIYKEPYFNSTSFKNKLVSGHPTVYMGSAIAKSLRDLFARTAVDYDTYLRSYIGI